MTAQRVEAIRDLLAGSLEPTALDVEDEGHLHIGHAGAKTGKGHFFVRIRSPRFEGLAPLARHRLVYDALSDIMESEIHALRIDASP